MTKPPKIIILKGLPASGKTTWAKAEVEKSEGRIKRVNKDDLRAMLDAGKWSKEREETILRARDWIVAETLALKKTIIVDDTNLHPKHFETLQDLAELYSAEIEINDSFLSVPMKECIRRDALRPNPVGRDVIRRMARDFGVGMPEPYYIAVLPYAVICDIDGTLAILGKRNPYDASTCEQDKVNLPVSYYLQHLDSFNQVFLFSGREEKYREQTESWLKANRIPYNSLHMRPTGNSEKDVIIKKRMFEEHIRGKFNVHVVLDDRDQVVDGWRELGLTCFQVADGDF